MVFSPRGIKLTAIKAFPHLPADAFCRDRLSSAIPRASFALAVPLPALGWGEGGLGVSDDTLIFSKRLIKAISLPMSCTGMSPAVHSRGANTPCTRSRFPPTALAGSCVALHPLSCHQDTSRPFISLCWFLVCFIFGYRRKRGGRKEGKQPLAGAAGEIRRAELRPLFRWAVFLRVPGGGVAEEDVRWTLRTQDNLPVPKGI